MSDFEIVDEGTKPPKSDAVRIAEIKERQRRGTREFLGAVLFGIAVFAAIVLAAGGIYAWNKDSREDEQRIKEQALENCRSIEDGVSKSQCIRAVIDQ